MRTSPKHSRKDEVYRYLRTVLRQRSTPPSVREIQSALGFRSTSTVHFYLKKLEEEGRIRRNERASRSIELVLHPFSQVAEVPLLGGVKAGPPNLAEEAIEETLLLPRLLAAEGDCFALRVEGDSMNGAGILAGDIVVVARQATVRDGDIAVVLLGEEATVKRVYRRPAGLLLQPENPDYEPIIRPDAQILGRVVGLVRRYA